MASHDSLELGELEDHVGDEVRLAQRGRAVDRVDVGPDRRRDEPGVGADTGHLGADAAELGLEHHAVEGRHASVGGLLLVLGEEEPGIGQPGSEHALIAAPHDIDIPGDRAGNGNEPVEQSARRIFQGEVALVRTHGQDDDLGRQLEVRGIELAAHGDRVLDQQRDLVEQGARKR